MSNGRLSAVLAYCSGFGLAVTITMGQWQESMLWALVIFISAIMLNREIKK